MTKPISRKMAVDCLLWRLFTGEHVRLDILCSAGIRIVCPICKEDLKEGQDIQFDHVHADIFDGPHEYQNLRPVHAECHKIKTKADIQANAKVKRLANPKPSKHPMKKNRTQNTFPAILLESPMAQPSKYTDEQRGYIRELWTSSSSANTIAKRFSAKFGVKVSRCAILGIASRMKLPRHEFADKPTPEASTRRLATMLARGIPCGPKPKKPVLAPHQPSDEPKPLGTDTGCKWLHGDDPKTWVFCGHSQKPGAPYCSFHYERAHAPQKTSQLPRKHIGMNLDRQFR